MFHSYSAKSWQIRDLPSYITLSQVAARNRGKSQYSYKVAQERYSPVHSPLERVRAQAQRIHVALKQNAHIHVWSKPHFSVHNLILPFPQLQETKCRNPHSPEILFFFLLSLQAQKPFFFSRAPIHVVLFYTFVEAAILVRG